MAEQPLFASSLQEEGYLPDDAMEKQQQAEQQMALGQYAQKGPGGGDDAPGKMFIGGLSWETTRESLESYFSKFGPITDCIVMKDPATGRSRGFGFITFADPRHCDDVMQSGPHVLDQRTIDPKLAVPRSPEEARAGSGPGSTGGPMRVEKTRKVFVGGLPYETTEDQMREFFSQYGKVEEVVLMVDRETRRPRGFGFVTFDTEGAVDKLCEEHYIKIGDKQVEIKRAEPKSTMDALRGRGGMGAMRGRGRGRFMSSSSSSYAHPGRVGGYYSGGAAGAGGGSYYPSSQFTNYAYPSSYGAYAGSYAAGYPYASYGPGGYSYGGAYAGDAVKGDYSARYSGGYGSGSGGYGYPYGGQGGGYDDYPSRGGAAYEGEADDQGRGGYAGGGARYPAEGGGYYASIGANYNQDANHGPTRSAPPGPTSGYRPY